MGSYKEDGGSLFARNHKEKSERTMATSCTDQSFIYLMTLEIQFLQWEWPFSETTSPRTYWSHHHSWWWFLRFVQTGHYFHLLFHRRLEVLSNLGCSRTLWDYLLSHLSLNFHLKLILWFYDDYCFPSQLNLSQVTLKLVLHQFHFTGPNHKKSFVYKRREIRSNRNYFLLIPSIFTCCIFLLEKLKLLSIPQE